MIFTTETNKNKCNEKKIKLSVVLGDAPELLFHLNSTSTQHQLLSSNPSTCSTTIKKEKELLRYLNEAAIAGSRSTLPAVEDI